VRNKLKSIEKSLAPKNKGYVNTYDAIYIRTMLDLLQIMQVRDEGDLSPGTKLFITKKLYKKLNMSPEEMESYIDKHKKEPFKREETKVTNTVATDEPEEKSYNTEEIIEKPLISQLLRI
jgi:hypothetical protein